MITFNASTSSKLKWPEIEQIADSTEKVDLALDFGIDPAHFNLKDQITFFSLSIAVGEFISIFVASAST